MHLVIPCSQFLNKLHKRKMIQHFRKNNNDKYLVEIRTEQIKIHKKIKNDWRMQQEMAENERQETLVVLFSREQDLETIMSGFCNSFGIENSGGNGNHLHLENNVQMVDINVFISTMGEDFKEFIAKQKNMVSGYFSQIKDCDEDVKINLIHHIQQSCTFIPIKIGTSEEKDGIIDIQNVLDIILDTMHNMDGVLVIDEGRTALNENGEVILSDEKDSQVEYYFPFKLKDNPEFLKDCTERQKARRDENMKYLFEKHIYVCELPVNEDDECVKLRNKEEVVKRMIGTLVVSLYSEALLNPQENMDVHEAREFIATVMKNLSIDDRKEILTKEELDYINDDDSDEETRIEFSWHYEHLYALEWLLGMTEWNYPDVICDVGLMVRNINRFHSVEDICANTTLRPKKEILDKADLIYRMDWAAVDARIHRMSGPADLDGGVVQARHKTLNWMIRFMDEEDWDLVDIPT